MDYTSTLETLEGFSNALSGRCTHDVLALAILHALAKLRESQKWIIVVKNAPCSLYFES